VQKLIRETATPQKLFSRAPNRHGSFFMMSYPPYALYPFAVAEWSAQRCVKAEVAVRLAKRL